MLKYLLDTSVCAYVIKKRPIEVMSKFNEHVGQMAISSITLAELLLGCEKSQETEYNTRQVEDFCSRLTIMEYGAKAAQHYGSICAELENKGKPIDVNDLHIAGHARSESLILVSNNSSQLSHVSGLRTDNWITKQEKDR